MNAPDKTIPTRNELYVLVSTLYLFIGLIGNTTASMFEPQDFLGWTRVGLMYFLCISSILFGAVLRVHVLATASSCEGLIESSRCAHVTDVADTDPVCRK